MQRSRDFALTASITAALLAPSALAESPYTQPDDTWIRLDGTVVSVTPDAFTLDYGQGNVVVEMDDGDRDADAYKLVAGDRVTVSGFIDDDFYETTTIEAASVHVEGIGTTFYASSFDEEGILTDIDPVVISAATLQGRVASVDPEAMTFTLDKGTAELTVHVDEMPYNPLDDEGYQQLAVGDIVSVSGQVDVELFEGRVFAADTVTTLYNASSD